MSKTIEQKVVEMRFDNANFEKNVSTSMSTLEKFKQSLKFDGAVRGLNDLNSSAKALDMSGISSAAERIGDRFSAMEIVAVTALANIANSAVNAGKTLLKSLTLDPITDGFHEYELKMGAVQTIMAGTGESLDTVMDKLNELNTYSDKTIYSFSDMTTNIGKFTNAGVQLDDAVNAIKGIANAAAVSGANAQNASHAMYNFAQALSAGYVKLIDWKSIEIANMATMEFKQTLLDTALALGTVVKDGDQYVTTTTDMKGHVSSAFDAVHNFNDSLNHQWMTTDVLTQALEHYAIDVREMSEAERAAYREKLRATGYTEEQIDAIEELGKKAADSAKDIKTFTMLLDTLREAVGSGWAESFELLFGDFEEAKRLWTEFGEVIGGIIDQTSEARNALLSEGLSSGWKQLTKDVGSFRSIYEDELVKLARANGVNIDEIMKTSKDFADSLKQGWLSEDLLRSYFGTISDTGDVFLRMEKSLEEYSDAELEALGLTREQAEAYEALGASILESGVSLDEWVERLGRMSGRENLITAFWNAWNGGVKILEAVANAFKSLLPTIDGEAIYQFTVKLKELTETFQLSDEAATGLKNILTLLLAPVKTLANLAGKAAGFIGNLAERAFKAADSFLAMFQNLESWDDVLKAIFGDERYNRVMEATATIAEKLADVTGRVKNKFKELFDSLKGSEKIQNALQKLSDLLRPVGDWILDRIVEGLEHIAALDIDQLIASASQKLNEMGITFENIERVVSNVVDSIRNFFAQFSGSTIAQIDNTSSLLERFVSYLRQVKDSLVERDGVVLGKIFEVIGNGLKSIISFFTSAKNEDASFFDQLSTGGLAEFLKKLTAGRIMAFAFGVSVVKMFLSISNAAEGLGNVTKSITGLFNALTNRIKPSPILRVATAIGVLAASLVALSLVKPEGLRQATVSLFMVGTLLTGITTVLSLLNKFVLSDDVVKRFGEMSKAMTMIAGAFLMLSLSLVAISNVNPDHIVEQLGAFTAVLVEMVGTLLILSKTSIAIEKGVASLLSFAVSMLALTVALKMLSTVKLEDTVGGLIAMSILIGMMGVLALAVKNTSKITSKGFKSSEGSNFGGILSMALGLLVLVMVLKKLQNTDVTEMLETLPQFLVLLGMVATLAFVAKKAGNASMKAGVSIMMISAAMVILSYAVKQIGSLDVKEALLGGAVVSALMLICGQVTLLGQYASKNMPKAGVGILLMSGAILALGLAIKLIGGLDLATITKGGIAVGALMALMGGILWAARETKGAVASMITIAVIIGMLSTTLVMLTMIPFEDAIKASAVMCAVMLSFAAMLKIINGFEVKGNVLGKIMAVTAVMIAAMVAISVLNNLLKDTDYAGSAKNMLAFMGLVGAFGVLLAGYAMLLKLVDKFGNANIMDIGSKLVPVYVGLAAAMMIVHGLDILLGDVNYTESAKNMLAFMGLTAALGILLAGYTMLIKLVDKFGGAVDAELVAKLGLVYGAVTVAAFMVAGMVSLIGETDYTANVGNILSFMAVIGVLGLVLGEYAGLGLVIGKIGSVMQAIPFGAVLKGLAVTGIVIGAVGLVAGLLGALFKNTEVLEDVKHGVEILTEIGRALGGFFGGIGGGFLDGLSSIHIDESTVNSLKTLAEAFLIFTGAELLDGIARFMGSKISITQMGRELNAFAPYLRDFADKISGHDFSGMEAATQAAKGLTEIVAALPRQNGLVQSIIGNPGDMENFSTGIALLGPAMADFAEKTKDIQPETADAAITIGKSLAGLNKELPHTGGTLQEWIGEQNLETFSNGIVKFADGFVRFYNKLNEVEGGIKIDTPEQVAAVGKTLAELNATLPRTGGVLQEWIGTKDLDLFATNIGKFAEGFVTFYETISPIEGFNQEHVDAVTNIALAFAELNNTIPTQGGFINDFILGNQSLGNFGENLNDLGIGMYRFYTWVKNIDADAFSVAVDLADRLVQINNTFDQPKWYESNSLHVLSTNIGSLGSALAAFGGNISNTQFGNLDSVERVVAIIKSMDGIDADLVAKYAAGMATIATTGIQSFIDTFANNEQNFKDSGKNMVTQFLAGVIEELDRQSGGSGKFFEIGQKIANGFAEGLRDPDAQQLVRDAALELANIADETLAEALDEHSPSEAERQRGVYFDEGFANGVIDGQSAVEQSVTQTANMATNAFGDALFSGLQDQIGNATASFGDTFSSIGEMLPVDFSGALDNLSSAFDITNFNGIGDMLGVSVDPFSGLLENMYNPESIDFSGTFGGLNTALENSMPDDMTDMLGGFTDSFNTIPDTFEDSMPDDFSGMFDGMNLAIENAAPDDITDMLSGFTDSFSNIPDAFNAAMPKDYSGMFDGMSSAFQTSMSKQDLESYELAEKAMKQKNAYSKSFLQPLYNDENAITKELAQTFMDMGFVPDEWSSYRLNPKFTLVGMIQDTIYNMFESGKETSVDEMIDYLKYEYDQTETDATKIINLINEWMTERAIPVLNDPNQRKALVEEADRLVATLEGEFGSSVAWQQIEHMEIDQLNKMSDQSLRSELSRQINQIQNQVKMTDDPDQLRNLVQQARNIIDNMNGGFRNTLTDGMTDIFTGSLNDAFGNMDMSTITGTAYSVVDQLQGAYNNAQNGATLTPQFPYGYDEYELDASPVITPVLDLSQFQNGIGEMRNDLGSIYGSYGMAKQVRSVVEYNELHKVGQDVETIRALEALVQNMTENTYEQHNVYSLLSEYIPQLANMRVELDSGAMVGQIAPKLDARLGTYTKRQGRQ